MSSNQWAAKQLNGGASIPGIGYGLGTAHYKKTGPNGVNDGLVQNILDALKAGYRHLDCAQMYENEKSCGAALEKANVPRSELFITSKVNTQIEDIPATLKKQLSELKTDYVDLYLIHDPTAGDAAKLNRADLWKQMEDCKAQGLAKAIGVSNYRERHLDDTLAAAKEPIAANQIELHPYVIKESQSLLDYCAKKGILIEAYGPSVPVTKAAGGPVDAVLDDIAKDLGKKSGQSVTPGQVLLKWAQAKGAVVVTTSGKPSRMKEQLDTGALPDLTAEQVRAIQDAGKSAPVKRCYMAHTV